MHLFSSLSQQLVRRFFTSGRPLPGKARLAIRQMYRESHPKTVLREVQDDLFEPLIEAYPGCAIVVDGIDESEQKEVDVILKYLRTLKQQCFLKLLISARSEPSLPSDAVSIHIDGAHPDQSGSNQPP